LTGYDSNIESEHCFKVAKVLISEKVFPNLAELELRQFKSGWDIPDIVPLVNFSRLKALSLTFSHGSNTEWVR
jgi:hypothetical protein